MSRPGRGTVIFELLWLENGGISGAQIRIAPRGAGAQSDAMI